VLIPGDITILNIALYYNGRIMMKVSIHGNLLEVFEYNIPNLHIRAGILKLSYFPNKASLCHWHSNLEFIIILEGCMTFSVNNTDYLLSEGMGIIVNSNRLHFNSSFNNNECTYILLNLSPSFLVVNPYIESRYVNHLLYDADNDAIILSENVSWNQQALVLIKAIFQLCLEQSERYKLQVLSQFYSLLSLLYENTIDKTGYNENQSKDLNTLKDMIEYIKTHYAEKISVNEIASAGMMCRSKCFSLFKEILHHTPFEYLQNYRIQKSIQLLADKTLSIMDISVACGFNEASYYTEVFKKITGTLPSDYRKNIS
jgi:AraC family transcriptional regulator, melibiose operon regulatory protein